MSATTTTQGATNGGDPWPAPQNADALVLAFATTHVERELMDEWIAHAGCENAQIEMLERPDARLEQALSTTTSDPYVVPARVAWLPRERNGVRSARLADVLSLTNPRRPGPRMQSQILRHEPDRCRVIAGEPARLSDLRNRFREDSADDGFATFVGRQAVLALARAERQHAGLQYKVPRLVVEEIEASVRFRERIAALAASLGRPQDAVAAEAGRYLHEMVASHSRLAIDAWEQFGRWLSRAYSVEVDEAALNHIQKLSRRYPLAFLPSHRSYLDPLVLRSALHRRGFAPNHVLGGLNVGFWPIGPVARRSGVVFIRRSVKDEPVYKLVLREYIAYLVRKRFNLEWYVEGGRTRTGKLRPPRYGLLNYLVDAQRSGASNDVMLIPTSIVYDQLYEVGAMAAEEHGAPKTPESLGWLVGYARAQGRGFGMVRVQFGEPLSLKQALADAHGEHDVERVAFEVCHRINRATPITETALVALALLGVGERALTLEEVRQTVVPLLAYVRAREVPITGALDLASPDGVEQALDALTRHGVVTKYDGGIEPVWSIGRERHLEVAFYRNSVIHLFVTRAIAELVLLHLDEHPTEDPVSEGWAEALRVRDVLKFEFFFARKREFETEFRDELALIDPEWEQRTADSEAPRRALDTAEPLLAPRVLSAFVEAYLVVAERLQARGDETEIDEQALLKECLGVAHQYRLQQKLHSTESISKELFANGLKLARNRGLLERAEGRDAFAKEMKLLSWRLGRLRALALAR